MGFLLGAHKEGLAEDTFRSNLEDNRDFELGGKFQVFLKTPRQAGLGIVALEITSHSACPPVTGIAGVSHPMTLS